MKSAIALGAVAAVFLVGTVVGAMGMHLYEQHHGSAHAAHDLHDTAHAAFMKRLHLSHEQRVAVDRILAESRRETHALHERLLPQVNEHMQHVHDRIRQVLDPEQQETFADMLERDHRSMQHLLLNDTSPVEHREQGEHDPQGDSSRH